MTDAHTAVEAQLERSLREIGIPPRPVILDRIRAEMQKDEPDFNHLTRIIAADVALSASLINITNSPFFGFRGRVNSPREALMMLGLNVAGKAIAGIVMRQAFPKSPHLERFWDASARIARLSGWLAQQLTKNSLRADDAYTFGLFRDCGIPILLTHNPGYLDILNRANHETSRSFTEVEDSALPTNHAIIGSMLAQSWWLADETCTSIRNHHGVALLHTPTIPPSLNSRYMIAVAQLAEHLLQQHSGLSFTQEWVKLGPACLQLLNLCEEDIKVLLDETIPVIDAED
ncbi:MAG: HDOD domain-containing protein [Proteobacteria bacterium]|nr:HDOD domain-containing protein [Pseudomonadota bacterium]